MEGLNEEMNTKIENFYNQILQIKRKANTAYETVRKWNTILLFFFYKLYSPVLHAAYNFIVFF